MSTNRSYLLTEAIPYHQKVSHETRLRQPAPFRPLLPMCAFARKLPWR